MFPLYNLLHESMNDTHLKEKEENSLISVKERKVEEGLGCGEEAKLSG